MNGITQQFEAVQRMMLVPSSAALQDNVRRFWDTQDKLLDNMAKFTNGPSSVTRWSAPVIHS